MPGRALRVHILPDFGHLLLKDLRVDHANRLVAQLRKAGHVPKGINMILGVLLTLLNDAIEWQFLARNPLARYKPVKEPELHFDYWSATEVRQFLSATMFDPYQPLYIAAVNTGMRRGELCGLKWDRIDLARNQITISRSLSRYGLSETTKSGKKRFVPINAVMKALFLNMQKSVRGEYVFSESDGSPLDVHHMYRDFRAAQSRAGFSRLLRFHDLRHTFASHFMMNDGNIYDLQKILGHSSLEMTQRYAHMSPDHLAKAIQVVSFAPDELGENVISLEGKRIEKCLG
ncbi:MAG: site-specific integrase [Proteobacteria bacterium]|nr:MAG: site-specific integrase [Pseudomonadota bacterium]